MKTCPCGSGLDRSELVDAAGIFCCFTCADCLERKLATYKPSIFTPGTPYAASGDESDIPSDDGE